MRKTIFTVFTVTVLLALCSGAAYATPMDLGTFSPDPAFDSAGNSVVTESFGTVTFNENAEFGAIYFADPAFSIPGSAVALSFDYSFALGASDYDDYFVLELDFTEIWSVSANGSGSVSIDFSPLPVKRRIWRGGLYGAGTRLPARSPQFQISTLPPERLFPNRRPYPCFSRGFRASFCISED